MKLTVKGHFVTIYASKDTQAPAGLTIDGVFIGNYANFDATLQAVEATIETMKKIQGRS